jgi:microsomal dipeptidase-like Zn-dependent dipeptidase
MQPVIDLHAHPYLKINLYPYLANSFHAFTFNGGIWNPLTFEYQYVNLARSPVKLVLNAHYVVERGFLAEGMKAVARGFMWTVFPRQYRRMLQADPWDALCRQMDGLEKAIANTNRFAFGQAPRLKLVRSIAEYEALGAGEIGVAHSVEGPHVFGYDIDPGLSPADFWDRTRQRLHHLRDRGVCLLTVAHFWDQPFVPQVDSVEYKPRKQNGRIVRWRDDRLFAMKRAAWQWGDFHGLGEKLAREMFEIGMVIDLAHVQDHARWAIYDLAAEYRRPVVLSHVGLRRFYDMEYNASDDEIRRVHQLGGLIGLVFSKRLLVDPVDLYHADGRGVPTLVEHMRYVRDLVGDVSCLAIGTDFDGFTHPMRDCYHPAHLSRLHRAMQPHFTAEEIAAIFHGNAARVLRAVWGVAGARPAPAKKRASRPRRKASR